MPQNIILIHGYSVQSLDAYNTLPELLANDGYQAQHIYLSAFDSLNNNITCDDLANALETRVTALEANGLDLTNTGVIAHSTGAIIARRWMLNRWMQKKKNLPSHFVSLAGANHGSTLAQLGTMQIVYLYRELFKGTQVGAEVLQDLDYGSDFLLKLNSEWLDAYNASAPLKLFSFSLIGDNHSSLEHQLFWQTHENGSDGTVRISSGNLNYRMCAINQNDPNPALVVNQMPFRVPHLVLSGVSHTGDIGILGGNTATMQIVYPRIKEALQVASKDSYSTLATNWQADTDQWNATDPSQCNSTIAFSLYHPGGRKVEDSLILIHDSNIANDAFQSLSKVKAALEPRQPIQNDTVPSSVSFYVNQPNFNLTYPHTVEIRINSGCDEIIYPVARYSVLSTDAAAIQANEFMYVNVMLNRNTESTYEIIPFGQNPDMHALWPPLPQPKS